MSINWNLYLSRYQQARGGQFFGALEDAYDCHLILTEGEETPLLVWIDTDVADGCSEQNILARAMVKLDGEYDLQIDPRSLVGGGLMSVASLVKGGHLGQQEHTRGRIIVCSNKYLCHHVLEEPGVQKGLTTWKKVYLKVRPAPRGEGWHVVEIADINFEGHPVTGSHWICEAMDQDQTRLSQEEQDRLLREGSDHFNAQMDAFLDFLRAACRAVTTWKP